MKSCIVVGAGPAGIVATKELLEAGFSDVICLEQSDKLGGVFSDSYDNLVLTSSVTFSMFSDYWVGDGKSHHFWTKDEAVDYWESYADHFGVSPLIRYNSKVGEVIDQNEKWEVCLEDGTSLECDHLILAVGNNRVQRYPDWKNELTDVQFFHSGDYKNANNFRGKRVLVVGGGESGSDLAYEISRVADKCWVSLRESTGWVVPRKRAGHAADVSTHRGIWDLPREFGTVLSPFVLQLERARKDPVFDALADLNEMVKAERGLWGIYGTKTLALPKAIAYYDCEVVKGVNKIEGGGRTIHAADDQKLDQVDAVVFCTGYHNRVSFLPASIQSCDPRNLYKHMFHPEFGSRIVWIGWARPGFGSQFPIMEMQSRYCALVLSGERQLPNPSAMNESNKMDEAIYVRQFEDNAARVRSLVDYHVYMNDLSKIIGCFPPLKRTFFTRPKLWLHLMYGPTQASQFRLRGPGKKAKLARKIIRKLPMSSFNHIVKAGIRGRIKYALQSLTSTK